MPNFDLLDLWDARSADPAELEQLLLSYFGGVRFGDDGYAVYGKDQENPRLVVTYKKGRPARAEPGPGYTDADRQTLLQRIQGLPACRGW